MSEKTEIKGEKKGKKPYSPPDAIEQGRIRAELETSELPAEPPPP